MQNQNVLCIYIFTFIYTPQKVPKVVLVSKVTWAGLDLLVFPDLSVTLDPLVTMDRLENKVGPLRLLFVVTLMNLFTQFSQT